MKFYEQMSRQQETETKTKMLLNHCTCSRFDHFHNRIPNDYHKSENNMVDIGGGGGFLEHFQLGQLFYRPLKYIAIHL